MSRLRRLVLVRHGETVGQSSIRYYGATDLALSELGLQQMRAVAAALQDETYDLVLTSALQRTRVAAELIKPQTPRRIVPGFNEIDFGAWEGWTKEEIAARDPQGFALWQSDAHRFAYPGGDSVPAFRARVAGAWHEVAASAPEHLLLVVHRGIILTIASELLALSDAERTAWPTALGSIHVLEHSPQGWRAALVDEVAHLAPELHT